MESAAVKSQLKGGEFLLKESTIEDIFIPEDFNEEQKMIRQTAYDFLIQEVLQALQFANCIRNKTPSFLLFIKNGITEPFDPITLPYLTTENRIGFHPVILFAATNSLSEASLVAPYKLIGAQALSVESATTLDTVVCKAA